MTVFEYVQAEEDEKQPNTTPSLSHENDKPPESATSIPSVEKIAKAGNNVMAVTVPDNPSQLTPAAKIMPVLPLVQPDTVIQEPGAERLDFAQAGIEPVNNIWGISPMQDDIDHLQNYGISSRL
ncbi:hypothetical protein [Xenorhabdus szentirmaii]|uniref:hypothetical protein n=1 Tax=Xenorhabdus szentirmaii TaxID=290112 RepID=UPI0019A9913E|nr:hypothetical protein [Xenorhabdus sp. 38]MBD2780534.1 hypothetical protein [Xenorhabdus sp. 38]